jgi:hypothetical protein
VFFHSSININYYFVNIFLTIYWKIIVKELFIKTRKKNVTRFFIKKEKESLAPGWLAHIVLWLGQFEWRWTSIQCSYLFAQIDNWIKNNINSSPLKLIEYIKNEYIEIIYFIRGVTCLSTKIETLILSHCMRLTYYTNTTLEDCQTYFLRGCKTKETLR